MTWATLRASVHKDRGHASTEAFRRRPFLLTEVEKRGRRRNLQRRSRFTLSYANSSVTTWRKLQRYAHSSPRGEQPSREDKGERDKDFKGFTRNTVHRIDSSQHLFHIRRCVLYLALWIPMECFPYINIHCDTCTKWLWHLSCMENVPCRRKVWYFILLDNWI